MTRDIPTERASDVLADFHHLSPRGFHHHSPTPGLCFRFLAASLFYGNRQRCVGNGGERELP
jgi:hypothetical protein